MRARSGRCRWTWRALDVAPVTVISALPAWQCDQTEHSERTLVVVVRELHDAREVDKSSAWQKITLQTV